MCCTSRNWTRNPSDSCIPLPFSEDCLAEIVPKAKDFALLHGAGIRYKQEYDPDILQMAPFYLLPSPFPHREFDRVVKLQPVINKLVHKIAHDYSFLKKCLANTIKVDDFTQRLWEIYETVRSEGVTQSLSLGLLRCDYFSCVPCAIDCCCCKQVEVNTIASSFGALSSKLMSVHRYVLNEIGQPELLKYLPENPALEKLCSGMIKAWELYNSSEAVIMFLIEDVTYNICDQRFHEYELSRQRPDIPVKRHTLTEVKEFGLLTEDKRLIVKGKEIAVIYFRAGYEPGHYHTEGEWEARLMMERSKAIKSPSIYYHLTGTKKVQQEISLPGVLEMFLTNSEAQAVRELFTGLYSLDIGPGGDAAIEAAMKNPNDFVLKPQREGGGNNIYGEEIPKVLAKLKDSSEREAYILMDKICPPAQKNYLVRPHHPVMLADTVSELGIFGVIIGTSSSVLENYYAGHMLRTKLASVNEGGVAAGLGALDSVILYD